MPAAASQLAAYAAPVSYAAVGQPPAAERPASDATPLRSTIRADIDRRVNRAAIAALARAKGHSKAAAASRQPAERALCVAAPATSAAAPAPPAAPARRVAGRTGRERCRGCVERAAEAARLGDELVRSDCEWRRMVHLLEGELVASRRTVTRLEVEISRD